MIVYISGKVTGKDPEAVKKSFGDAEILLRSKGHKVVNPVKLCSSHDDWVFAMKKCIAALMECNAIYILDDWINSKGARIEYNLANQLNFKLFNDQNPC